MLVVSFGILVAINGLTWRAAERRQAIRTPVAPPAAAPAAASAGGEL